MIVHQVLILEVRFSMEDDNDAIDGSVPPGDTESSVQPIIDVSDALADVEIQTMTFNCKTVGIDQAYKQAKDLVDNGARNWKRTNFTIIDSSNHKYQLSCSTCGKNFAAANPGNFWSSHSKQCTAVGAPLGQVLQQGKTSGTSQRC